MSSGLSYLAYTLYMSLKTLVEDMEFENLLVRKTKEWVGVDIPQWMQWNVSAQSGHTLRLTTKAHTFFVPAPGHSVTSIDRPGKTFEVGMHRMVSMLATTHLKREDLLDILFREIRGELTELEDPRLFWNPRIRGPLPASPLLDPSVSFDRAPYGTYDREGQNPQYPAGTRCPVCREPTANREIVWGGATLFWVHTSCVSKVFK